MDKIHEEHPKLTRDQFWSKLAPNVLPYTLASEKFLTEYPSHSTRNVKVKPKDSEMYIPDERRVTFNNTVINKYKALISIICIFR